MTTPSRTAIHEAAHALVACRFGGRVERCEVFSDGGGKCLSKGLTRRQRLRVVLGGHVGAALVFGGAAVDPDLSAADISKASGLALSIVRVGEAERLAARGLEEPDERMLKRYSFRAEKLVALAEAEVRELLYANRPALERLAARLEAHRVLDSEAVDAVLAETAP